MEKITIITSQSYVEPLVISWLRAAFPQHEIDIIYWKGGNPEDHPLLQYQQTDWDEGLTREVKW